MFLVVATRAWADEPAKEANDPLPNGAVVRFGVTRPILRTGPAVGLIAPKYTNFLAPTMTGGVRRYDLATGRPLDKKGIVGPGLVVVSADGKRAAVARSGAINVVEVATGKQLRAVAPPEGVLIVGTPGVGLSADGRILAYGGRGQDNRGAAVVLDVDQNEVLAVCDTHQLAPVQVTLSRDGRTLVTYGPPAAVLKIGTPAVPKLKLPEPPDGLRTAQVWEVASGRELFKARVTGMDGHVCTAALSPDADLLAIAAGDGPVDLFDVKTGKRLHTLLGRKTQGVKVAFSPDGKLVASVGLDYRIQRWTSTGKPLDVTDAPFGLVVAPITGLEFADNERAIASMTAAQFAYAWDAPTGKLLSPEMDHAASIRSIAFPKQAPPAKDLYTSGIEGRAFRWNLATGALNEEMAFRPARIPGQPLVRPIVHFSSDGTRAVWPKGAIAEVFDVSNGDNLFVLPPPSSPPAAVNVALSQDGMRVAMMSRPAAAKRTGMCVIWDLATQERVAELETPSVFGAGASAGCFNPDGTRFAIVAFANRPQGLPVLTLVGHDLKTGKKLATVEDPTASGTVSFAIADDTTMIGTSNTGRVWTVDYVNGQVGEDIDSVLPKGEAPFHGPIAISPDGKHFAVGIVGEPFTTYGVRVYNLATRKAIHTFMGHAGPVTALHFGPDGSTLASGAEDTSVILWDLINRPKEK
jgi:WD40 repeat protein